ncbi:MAG TPA: glutamate formiminotransferase, partial [Bryobacteraceae bacterium]
MHSLIECVPNFSEGRDFARIHALESAIAAVPGTLVLDRTSDPDHHRSVITFAGDGESVLESAVRAVSLAAKLIDLNQHHGVHPRLGALDVLPFVPLGGATLEDCVALAHRSGRRIWNELGIPVYFYQAAALRPDRVQLEQVRRGQFEGLREAVLNDE